MARPSGCHDKSQRRSAIMAQGTAIQPQIREAEPEGCTIPPNIIATNVNTFSGDLLLTCSYSPQVAPAYFNTLAVGRKSFSFCPELTHLDKLGFKLCTIFRLRRVTSLVVLTKDGSPHSMQIPLMVQEAAEDTGFDKANIQYFCIEGGKLHSIDDLAVRKARHFSEIQKLLPFAQVKKVTEILRGENGCPNDRKETFESVLDHLREETEEVGEAIQSEDIANLKIELADVFFNICLAARIAEERNLFSLEDIAATAAQKMIDRHPQVFETVKLKY
jgi:NTP pyrophosphatase (non-canonical NTP hydrolase)